MKSKLFFAAGLAAIPTVAHAGAAIPSPEAGAGLASMAIMAAGYIWMRKRIKRD